MKVGDESRIFRKIVYDKVRDFDIPLSSRIIVTFVRYSLPTSVMLRYQSSPSLPERPFFTASAILSIMTLEYA